MIGQTLAILGEAYRNLHAKKTFWAVLAISVVLVGSAALLHVEDDGVYLLSKRLDRARTSSSALFTVVFALYGVRFWLAFLASILGLLALAGMFPDFMKSGKIDLVLCRPIGRWRLVLTQFVGGLLFMVLQVSVFCVGAFLVMGWRGGIWNGRIFWAIPIVTCLFSYLFAFCALIGILTRSERLALMLTLLLWVLVWGVSLSTDILEMRIDRDQAALVRTREKIGALEPRLERGEPDDGDWWGGSPRDELADRRERLEDIESDLATMRVWKSRLDPVRTVLPKTGETADLLWYAVIRPEDERRLMAEPRTDSLAPVRKNPFWVLGTSLAFEAVVLLLAIWRFRRRDF